MRYVPPAYGRLLDADQEERRPRRLRFLRNTCYEGVDYGPGLAAGAVAVVGSMWARLFILQKRAVEVPAEDPPPPPPVPPPRRDTPGLQDLHVLRRAGTLTTQLSEAERERLGPMARRFHRPADLNGDRAAEDHEAARQARREKRRRAIERRRSDAADRKAWFREVEDSEAARRARREVKRRRAIVNRDFFEAARIPERREYRATEIGARLPPGYSWDHEMKPWRGVLMVQAWEERDGWEENAEAVAAVDAAALELFAYHDGPLEDGLLPREKEGRRETWFKRWPVRPYRKQPQKENYQDQVNEGCSTHLFSRLTKVSL